MKLDDILEVLGIIALCFIAIIGAIIGFIIGPIIGGIIIPLRILDGKTSASKIIENISQTLDKI